MAEPAREYCNFDGWKPHFIANVYEACTAWMETNWSMQRTAHYIQMQMIRDEARRAWEAIPERERNA